MEARIGGHGLGGEVTGGDEGLGHAHRHGDDVSQGEQRLRVSGPHVGVLLQRRLRHGDALVCRARGLVHWTGGAGGWGGHGREGGVAGYPG